MPYPTESTETWNITQIANTLNRAADDIIEATDAADEGLRDALNLMVNAVAAYLTGDAEDLNGVANNGYEADLDQILNWIAQGIR